MKSTKYIEIIKAIGSHKNFDFEGLWNVIELATGLKLRAKNETDILDGYVIVYGDNIQIFFYDEDEVANEGHKNIFKKKIPTPKDILDIKNIINAA